MHALFIEVTVTQIEEVVALAVGLLRMLPVDMSKVILL